jgi:hypothetical protein
MGQMLLPKIAIYFSGLFVVFVLNSCVSTPVNDITRNEINSYLDRYRTAFIKKDFSFIRQAVSDDLVVTAHYLNSTSMHGKDHYRLDRKKYLSNTMGLFNRVCNQSMAVTKQVITIARDHQSASVISRTRYHQQYVNHISTVEVYSKSKLKKMKGKIKLTNMDSRIQVLKVRLRSATKCENPGSNQVI